MIMATGKSMGIIFGILMISAWVLGSAVPVGAETSILNEYTTAWNSHDTEKVVSFFTDDGVYEELGIGVIKRGREELRAFINNFFANFPDTTFELTSSFISGNWYCAEWVWRGTPQRQHGRVTRHRQEILNSGGLCWRIKGG
jgi:uncharacterized protein (TIGR02246 family)